MSICSTCANPSSAKGGSTAAKTLRKPRSSAISSAARTALRAMHTWSGVRNQTATAGTAKARAWRRTGSRSERLTRIASKTTQCGSRCRCSAAHVLLPQP